MKSLLVACLAVAIMGSTAVLAADEAADVTRVRGTVAVTKDDAGQVTAIEIKKSDGTALKVKLDEQGLKLAEMDGKTVMAKGAMADDMLVVQSCTEAKVGQKKEGQKKEGAAE